MYTCKTVELEYIYLLHVPCNIFNKDNDLHCLHNYYGMYLYCIKSAVAYARASDFSKSSSSRSITSIKYRYHVVFNSFPCVERVDDMGMCIQRRPSHANEYQHRIHVNQMANIWAWHLRLQKKRRLFALTFVVIFFVTAEFKKCRWLSSWIDQMKKSQAKKYQ